MEAIECIKTRRSVRRFTDEPIGEEVLQKIVEAAVMSPSWKNSQTIRYHIVTDKELIAQIADKGIPHEKNNRTVHGCSALAVQTIAGGICGFNEDGSPTTEKGNGWEMYDAGIAAQTFCLAAHNYGVGTVIMGITDYRKIKEFLNIPENEIVAGVIPMGYPAEQPTAPKRKALEEIAKFY